MKLWRYTAGPTIACTVTLLLMSLVVFVVLLKWPGKRADLIMWISLHAFPDILKKKKAEHGSTTWLFSKKDITNLEKGFKKIMAGMTGIAFSSFTNASLIFWQTLLLEISYDCELEDKTKECFPHDSKLEVKIDVDPINCNSPEIVNGTVTVICYRLVFNIGVASGACYGVFRLISVALSFTASLMLLHKKVVKIVRYIMAVLVLVVIVISFAVTSKWGSMRLDTNQLVTVFQLTSSLGTTVYFVFFIPWNDLNDEPAQASEMPV